MCLYLDTGKGKTQERVILLMGNVGIIVCYVYGKCFTCRLAAHEYMLNSQFRRHRSSYKNN